MPVFELSCGRTGMKVDDIYPFQTSNPKLPFFINNRTDAAMNILRHFVCQRSTDCSGFRFVKVKPLIGTNPYTFINRVVCQRTDKVDWKSATCLRRNDLQHFLGSFQVEKVDASTPGSYPEMIVRISC